MFLGAYHYLVGALMIAGVGYPPAEIKHQAPLCVRSHTTGSCHGCLLVINSLLQEQAINIEEKEMADPFDPNPDPWERIKRGWGDYSDDDDKKKPRKW